MINKKKVLLIQHASEFGGSVMSLLYTISGLIENHKDLELILVLGSRNIQIENFYKKLQIKIDTSYNIPFYNHSQAYNLNLYNPINWIIELKRCFLIIKAFIITNKCLNKYKPDLVHLNSVVLLGSAMAVKYYKIPLIWHVRENPVNNIINFRTNIIKLYLKRLAYKIIFISNNDYKCWGSPKNSTIIYNFVDAKKFDKNNTTKNQYKYLESIHTKKILFLGGVSEIKGTKELLLSLVDLKKSNFEFTLLFPNSLYILPTSKIYKIGKIILNLFGKLTYTQEVESIITKYRLEQNIIRFDYISNIEQILFYSDLLIFPSIRPHFARPIIEAQSMGVPVIASDLEGITELIDNLKTGILYDPTKITELTQAIKSIFEDNILYNTIISNARKNINLKFDQKINVKKIYEVYEKAIATY